MLLNSSWTVGGGAGPCGPQATLLSKYCKKPAPGITQGRFPVSFRVSGLSAC